MAIQNVVAYNLLDSSYSNIQRVGHWQGAGVPLAVLSLVSCNAVPVPVAGVNSVDADDSDDESEYEG